MSTQDHPHAELCNAAYRADQAPGMVIVHATGVHMTSGYHAFFEQLPIDIFPPEYRLWHTKPSGIVLEVVTPFAITTTFPATQRVTSVKVTDAGGKHDVPVEQVPDARARL